MQVTQLINRIDHVIFFDYLEKEAIITIATKIIDEHKDKLAAEHQITLTVTDDALMNLVDKGYNKQYGVRELKRAIDKSLLRMVTNYIFDHEGATGTTLICDCDQEGEIVLREE